MIGRRLEYESLKAVLLHMDANVRFKISFHMPSIKSVEKVVPLKIRCLYMQDNYTGVDGFSSYTLRTIRHYPEGNAPGPVLWEEIDGGSRYDFDEFGFPFLSKVQLNGDVVSQSEYHTVRYDSEEDEKKYTRKLRYHKKAVEILNDLDSAGTTLNEFLHSLEPLPNEEQFEEDNAVRLILRDTSRNLCCRIAKYNLKLQSFEWRRNNTKPPFTCYIQLNIMNEIQGSRQFQRFEYNKTLFEASKHLHEVLFGDRTMPIRIEKTCLSDGAVDVLPSGCRFQIRLSDETVIHKSLSLTVENSERLNKLDINSTELGSSEGQTARNARRLIFAHIDEDVLRTLRHVICYLSDCEMYMLPNDPQCLPQFFIALLDVWFGGGREVGACLWMPTENERTASEVLEFILSKYQNSKRTERCITVPLRNSTVLEARSVPFRDSSWMLKMNIVKV